MNYYLIIILFSVSIFLSAIVNFNIYGFEVSKRNYMNDNNDFGFIPIKSKILPQYDGSNPQTETKVKPKTVSVAENTVKSNATSVVAYAAGVKILSPGSGKQIPVGNLTIFGISTDNEKSDCTVSVDWNNQKPFQKAKATGPYGEDDYSSWTYTYSTSYHTIEKGLNDLTSKLECLENSKVTTKWHSINVSGVITNDSNLSSDLVFHDPLGILPQLNSISTKPSADTSVISSNVTTLAPSKLFANMELSKEVLVPGDIQNFTIKISDSNSQQVAAANIGVKIMQGTKILSEYNGTSDTSGMFTQSWNLNSDIPSGKYDVLVSASADGYVPASLKGSFQVQRQLLVEASLSKDPVIPGEEQAINVKVADANTKDAISGANVMGKIGGKKFSATTDDLGAVSYSWHTSPTSGGNSFQVVLDVTSDGYPKEMKTVSFKMDKPQNLLEPPISNYQNNVVKVKDSNNDLNNNLESTGDSPQCMNLISSIGCDIEGDDKPAATPVTDDKPAANTDVGNLPSGDNQDEKSAYDFLASATN